MNEIKVERASEREREKREMKGTHSRGSRGVSLEVNFFPQLSSFHSLSFFPHVLSGLWPNESNRYQYLPILEYGQ